MACQTACIAIRSTSAQLTSRSSCGQVHLKHAGMHKTPDILLTIPICVKGKAVHWIDSKV